MDINTVILILLCVLTGSVVFLVRRVIKKRALIVSDDQCTGDDTLPAELAALVDLAQVLVTCPTKWNDDQEDQARDVMERLAIIVGTNGAK